MEQRRIVSMWQQRHAQVLVTLIKAKGSSYRRPGARLLIEPGGTYEGTISGGCLESDVVRKAIWAVRDGAVVWHYATAIGDDSEIPFGLGCGGEIDLLMEPIETPECHALLAAMEAAVKGTPSINITWLPSKSIKLQRVILNSEGDITFRSNSLSMDQIAHARQFGAQDETEVVVEEIAAPQRLIVFGAGDDAKPLVRFASLLGWDVTVADQRPQLARKERFLDAACVFMGKAAKDLSVSPEDAVVVMTHSYEQDKELLALTLPKNPCYAGLLGARHRSSMLIYEVSSLLDWSVEEVCRRINAPVGLDIGGDGPEVIALAILSEAQARCQGKPGGSRKLSVDEVFQYVGKGKTAHPAKTFCSERDFG